MTEIKNQTGTKKKLLIPVIVLMLLAVGLTGAAYAYNSTLSVNNNAVDADSLKIDLNGGSRTTSNVIVTDGFKPIVFTDNIAYNASTKTNTVDADVNEGLFIHYVLEVSGDAPANKLTISSANIADIIGAELVSGVTVGQFFKIKVGLQSNFSDAQELTAAGYEFTIAHTSGTTVVDVYVSVAATAGAPEHVYSGAATNGKYAADFATLVTGNFTIAYDAHYTAPVSP